MEEILVLILQLVFEVIVQALIYGGLDIAAMTIGRDEKNSPVGCLVMFVFFLIGAGLGALANLIHPQPFLPEAWMRIANLIAAPLLVGGLSWLIADWRRRRGTAISPGLHFWFAFWFVLGFDLIRFIYGQHA